MGRRVDEYLELKKNKRRIFFGSILVIILFSLGVLVVDINQNKTIYQEDRIKLISFKKSESVLKFDFLNYKISIDYNKLKSKITGYVKP
jgi:hypothetical protein